MFSACVSKAHLKCTTAREIMAFIVSTTNLFLLISREYASSKTRPLNKLNYFIDFYTDRVDCTSISEKSDNDVITYITCII